LLFVPKAALTSYVANSHPGLVYSQSKIAVRSRALRETNLDHTLIALCFVSWLSLSLVRRLRPII